MRRAINLKSIYDLLGLNFFIPSYQRGYRWTDRQVKELLEDILDFTRNSHDTSEFYCLQPVVVKSCSEEMIKEHNLTSELDGNQWYEVIDGQQRLTTLHIFFSYFETFLGNETLQEAYGCTKYVLEYETRRSTRNFLENIANLYKNSENSKNIDCEHISQAYKTVEDWFRSQRRPREARNDIMDRLLATRDRRPVQVIWYDLSDQDLSKEGSRSEAINAFTRLNIGKIPLSNAELVKALFLQKRNFKDEDANLRQIEIAKEWDQMEQSLQREEFWAFLNEGENESSARIEFLFNLMYQMERRTNSNADKEYGKDAYASFRFFSKKFDGTHTSHKILQEWEKVKECFTTLQDWYEDNTWYHYIGYLIWKGNTSILEIYEAYKKNRKTAFTKELKEMVKRSIGPIEYSEKEGVHSFKIDYDSDKGLLRALFLLYNIEFILKKNSSYYLFPFHLFKSEKWDIEHISSQTENPLQNNEESQTQWLETALASLTKEEQNEFNGNDKVKEMSFEAKRNWIVAKVGEERIDEEMKNSIGNLTLLSANINRGYGNNVFPAKRKAIVEKDSDGAFIPICTKNVFLKYTTGGNNLRWEERDIHRYTQDIVDVLKDYLTKKNEE